ncbi:MAG: Uma2 family endonuclease [Gemmatimonadaceae bacterium]|nr:Uma2 family endonuclease [Gemmatimonadaceae bacterium]
MGATAVGMTAEQLLGYEAPGKRVELVRGQLIVREPAGFYHGSLTLRIGVALTNHLAREREARGRSHTRGRLATADPGFTLARRPDTVRAPDIAYVSRERFGGPMPDGFPELAPDLAVEVLSPTDRTGAIVAKVGDWLSAGTQLVWVVDPPRESVVVYRADGSVDVLGVNDTLSGDALLPGFALSLRELFAPD